MSRLLYNAGVWGPLRQADGRKMRGAYMAVMRVVQGKVHNPTAPRFTDAQVLVDADKPSLEHKLMALRLKLLLRFALHAPRQLVLLCIMAAPF